MQLELTLEEVRILADTLDDYLPGLRREASRTDQRGLRHELVMREEFIERLRARLEAQLTQVA